MIDLEKEMQAILNEEIAKELLIELKPDISEEKIKEIYALCDGNPWNAPILYKMLELTNENKSSSQES